MSRLIYNGIELSYLATQEIGQEPVMDDSGTDVMYWKWTLSVRAIIVSGQSYDRMGQPGYPVSPANGGEKLPEVMKRIRHQLETPRKELIYWSGGEAKRNDPTDALIWVNGIDAANGPMPGPCRITSVADGRYLVTWEITAHVVDCPNASNTDPEYETDLRKAVVSHRWSESQDIDASNRTVELTRKGKIVSRSDMVANADVLRSLVTPLPPKGFKWKRANYSLRADGLALEYSFAWEEADMMPPYPAYSADGEYVETYANAAERWGECWVRLEGPPKVDRIKLLQIALSVCVTKMAGQTFTGNNNETWLGAIALKEALYRPEVECRVRNRLKFDSKKVTVPNANLSAAISLRQFSPRLTISGPEKENAPPQDLKAPTLPGTPDEKLPAPFPARGTADIKLIAAALRDPCGQQLDLQSPAENIVNLQSMVTLPANNQPAGVDRYAETFSGSGPPLSDKTQVSGDIPVTVSIYPAYADFTESDSKVKDEDPGVYDVWQAKKRYFRKTFEVVMPAPGSPTGVESIELAAPIHYCELRFVAVKTGGTPRIPDPITDVPESWQLVGTPQVEFDDPVILADGKTLRQGVRGKYLWVITDPAEAYMAPPLPPYHQFEATDFNEMVSTTSETAGPDGLEDALTMDDVFTAE